MLFLLFWESWARAGACKNLLIMGSFCLSLRFLIFTLHDSSFMTFLQQSFCGPMVRIPPFQGGGSCSIHGSCKTLFGFVLIPARLLFCPSLFISSLSYFVFTPVFYATSTRKFAAAALKMGTSIIFYDSRSFCLF